MDEAVEGLVEELEELVRTVGVSGFEDDVRELIRSRVGAIDGAPEPRVDGLGNLIVEMEGGDEDAIHVVLIAHMDELGLLVTDIDDDGNLSFRKMGGMDDRTLVSRLVDIRTSGGGAVPGVIGLKPPHLMEDRSEMKRAVEAKDMRVDVGTADRDATIALGIRPMDQMVIRKDFAIMNEDVVVARGLDDRFGCLVLLEVLRAVAAREEEMPLRLSFVWSVQEEIGLRGALAIGNRLEPDVVFAVDSGTATDAPDIPDGLCPFHLGKGPGLRLVDNRAVASPILRGLLEDLARENDIPLQILVTGGGTDAAAIQNTGAAVMPVSVPLRYTHSTVECIHLRDLEKLIRLLLLALENMDRVF